MSALALIPARAGSKRLADKMLRRLGGKTLVQWAVESVLASGCFQRVIVSSDADAILDAVLEYPVEARRRPADLATDTATTMQVLRDVMEHPERHPAHPRSQRSGDHTPFDVVALCQPTTPFRTGDDVRATCQLLRGDVDAAIALMAAPIPPQRSFAVDAAGICVIPDDSPLRQGRTRKQSYQDMYTPNGAVYVSRRQHLLTHGSFFAGKVAGYVMPRERSLDIDDELDWKMAELLLRESK
jgi:CMP-N-acetylneuraminic acid synthetase